MAITEAYAGTETVSTTEWSLTTDTAGPDADTTDGVFECWVDCSALGRGDLFVVRAYEKVIASGTQRRVYSSFLPWTGPTPRSPMFVLPKLMLMHGWDFTLQKITGTDRAITWGIRAMGGTPTEYSEGTNTMTTSEYFIASESTTKTKQTSAGIYQLFLDTNAVAKADLFELKVTEEARAADTTEQVAHVAIITDNRSADAYVSPAISLMNGWDWGVDKISGTDRSMDYSLRKLG